MVAHCGYRITNIKQIYGYDFDNRVVANAISSSEIALSWNAISGANHYIVSRSTQSDGVYSSIYADVSTTTTDGNLQSSTEYYYQLQACTLTSDSTFCSESYGKNSTFTTPSSDASYTLTFVSSASATTISWSVSDGGYFKLHSSTDGSVYSQIFAGTDSSYHSDSLVAGGSYYYKLQLCGGSDSCLALANASSFVAVTKPDIAVYTSHSERDADNDFGTLLAASNDNPRGIWSDGSTMWVSDLSDEKIYAYNLNDKTRDSSQDFTTLSGAGNTSPYGIWSDGVTMWVADISGDKLYAYNLSSKARDMDKDFDSLQDAGNTSPYGIWSDGNTMWVVDIAGDKAIYAYNLATKERDASKDLTFVDDNSNANGIWSNGVTIWVADSGDDKLYGYNLATNERVASQDFDTLDAAGNNDPVALWSDGATMWVADSVKDEIYAYSLAANIDAVALGSSQIELSWDLAVGGTHYILYSSTEPDGVYTNEIYADSATTFVHSGLNTSSLYYYRLSACTLTSDSDSCTEQYGQNSIYTLPNSDASYTLTFVSSAFATTVSWSVSAGNYFILSHSSDDSLYSEIYSGTESSYKHSNLEAATISYYKVQICDSIHSCLLLADASSAISATVPDIADYITQVTQGIRSSDSDFDTLQVAGNADPRGIWSDGDTMWVADIADDKLYAYNMQTKARDADKDFDTLIGAGNNGPYGIWSDGSTMWVTDISDNQIYAYKMSDTTRDSSKDFDLSSDGYTQPYSIGSDGTTFWVLSNSTKQIYAYNLSTRQRDSDNDIDYLAAENADPSGIWTDGTRLWVVDITDSKVYAYNLATQQRDSTKDIDGLLAANNNSARDLWSDGSTMWISDHVAKQIYSYDFGIRVVANAISSSEIALSWNAISGANHYIVSRSTQSDGVYSSIYADVSTTTTDGNLQSSTEYYYQLQACTLTSDSTFCSESYGKNSTFTTPNSDASYTLTFVISATATTVSWSVSEGKYFKLSASTTDSNYNAIYEGTDSSYLYANIDDASSYYYKLQICSASTSCLALANASSFIATTIPDVSLYTTHGTRAQSKEFNGTDLSTIDGNVNLNGIWSDGTTLWVAFIDNSEPAIRAYDLNTKTAVTSQDITDISDDISANTLEFFGGMWSDGSTLWFVDVFFYKIYAYDIATKSRQPELEFNALVDFGVDKARGIWSDGQTLWVANQSDAKIYAYNLHSKARLPSSDFNTLVEAGNTAPVGIWSDGDTMWVTDLSDNKIYAYNLHSKARDSSRDFNTLASGNDQVYDLWSDGDTLFVSDKFTQIYAYRHQKLITAVGISSTQIQLSWEAITGVGQYIVYQSTQIDGTYSATYVTTNTTIADNLSADTQYYYYFDACTVADDSTTCANQQSGSNSGFTRPHSNASYTLTFVTSDFATTASWDVSAGSYFKLSASTNAVDYSEIYSGTATHYQYQGLESASSYHYKLQLCNDTNSCLALADASSASATTAPDIYAFASYGNAVSDLDIETLNSAGNTNPRGIWSDGITLWVADISDDKIYAYNLEAKTRDYSADFNSLASGNNSAFSLWSDGDTMWVADYSDDYIYAYNMADKQRNTDKEIDLSSAVSPTAIWSDGEIMWVTLLESRWK